MDIMQYIYMYIHMHIQNVVNVSGGLGKLENYNSENVLEPKNLA